LKNYFLIVPLLFLFALVNAQTISYPTPAENMVRGFGQTLLTVRIDFTSNCGNPLVNITLGGMRTPNEIAYVPGSVTKIGGTAALTITENNITDLKNPRFEVGSNVTSGNFIVFTIARKINCGAGSINRDYISITGLCTAADTDTLTNTYNVTAPNLSIAPPTNIFNGVIGGNYTRNITITNGAANTDTVRFFLVYPTAGVRLQDAPTHTLTIGGNTFTPWRTNADTLFYKFFGPTLFGGDAIFNNGESITITENAILLRCNAITRYGVYWGQQAWPGCALATAAATINMATGNPNVETTVLTTPIIPTNFCNDAVTEFTVRNIGTETVTGAATAFNLLQRFGLGNGTTLEMRTLAQYVRFEILTPGNVWQSITFGGGLSPTAATINFNQFTTDVDGVGGLQDVDLDGQFDDLPSGQELKIRAHIRYICSQTCNTNEHSGFLQSHNQANSQCGTAVNETVKITALGLFNRSLNTKPFATFATDLVNGQAATFTVNFIRDFAPHIVAGANRLMLCPDNKVTLKLAVPKGITLMQGRYIRNTGTNTPGIGTVFSLVTGSGTHDTVVVTGTSTTSPTNTAQYLQAAFEADVIFDCATYTGGRDISYNITYSCDVTCACQETWVCGVLPLIPHCPTVCLQGGLTMSKNLVKRITGGYTSPTSNTFVNTNTLKTRQTKIIEATDTLEGVFEGYLYNGTAAPNFANNYLRISYTTPGTTKAIEGLAGTLQTFDPITKALKNTYAVPSTILSTVTAGVHTILYNFSSYNIALDDSISFTNKFYVLKNTSFTSEPSELNNLWTTFYSATSNNSTTFTCDSFRAELYVYRPTFSRFDGQPATFNGCLTASVQRTAQFGYLIPGVDIYPGEIRPALLIDSILIELLSQDVFDVSVTPTLRSYGQIAEGYATTQGTVTTLSPVYSNNNRTARIYNTGGAWPKAETSGISTGQTGYELRYNFLNTCRSSATPAGLRVTYFAKNYAVTQNPALLENLISISIPNVTTIKPTLNLNSNGTVFATNNTNNFWDVRLSNSSNVNAPFAWFGFEKGTSGITIDSVKALNSTGTATVGGNITLNPYGAANNWVPTTSAGIAAAAETRYRVWFRYTSCNIDSIRMIAGYDCNTFPASPTTYDCSVFSTHLVVDPVNSAIDVTTGLQPASPTDLCTTNTTEFLYNSAGRGFVDNPTFKIQTPTGLTITNAQIEYPFNSGNFETITPTIVSGVLNYAIENHTAITALYGTSGMPGTTDFVGIANRQARLRLTFTTDCSFTVGSRIRAAIIGTRPCGQPISVQNGYDDFTFTNPININGAITLGTANMAGSATSGTNGCSPITVNANITPVLSATTPQDTLLITIPAGLQYNNDFSSTAMLTIVPGYPQPGVGGATILKIKIPSAQMAGSNLPYTFTVTPIAYSGCSQFAILHETERTIAPLTCNGMACTNAGVAIIGSLITTVSVAKTQATITALNVLSPFSVFVPGGNVNTRVTVVNSSNTQTIPANTLTIDYYCGNSSTPFTSRLFAPAIPALGSVSAVINITIANAPICNSGDLLRAVIRPSVANCVCDSSAAISATVLPITFTAFTLSNKINHAQINFSVANNANTNHYLIQASNNLSSFITLNQITNNTTKNNYTTLVQTPSHKYYRIAAVNILGNILYSEIKTLQSPTTVFEVYPNPANTTLQIVLNNNSNNTVQVIATDGKVVLTKNFNGNQHTLNTQALPNGKYVIKLITNSQVVTKQFTVVH
jgi:hypothetical protein